MAPASVATEEPTAVVGKVVVVGVDHVMGLVVDVLRGRRYVRRAQSAVRLRYAKNLVDSGDISCKLVELSRYLAKVALKSVIVCLTGSDDVF